MECYRLSALQCLLHLPRVMNWLLLHDNVQLDANGNTYTSNRCKTNERDEKSGDLLQVEQKCMACEMKKLVPHYWHRGNHSNVNRDSEVYPAPFNPDEPILKTIHDIAAEDDRFKPQQHTAKDGTTVQVDQQADAEEWLNYCLEECRAACHDDDLPGWEAGYRALFQFEFEEDRFCNACDTPIARADDDPSSSFKQPSIGFTGCVIHRANPGTVADAINDQMIELPTNGEGIRRNCPTCGSDQLLTRRFRIDAAPEYMLVKFNPTYDAAPPRSPECKKKPRINLRKITNKNELPQIDEKLDLTHCQVDPSTKLEYRLVAVLPHNGAVKRGHWIATVRNHPRWYNINDGHVQPVTLDFALSNPEVVPTDWNGTEEEKAKDNREFQVVVLMYARVR